jgi:hypothetical protein
VLYFKTEDLRNKWRSAIVRAVLTLHDNISHILTIESAHTFEVRNEFLVFPSFVAPCIRCSFPCQALIMMKKVKSKLVERPKRDMSALRAMLVSLDPTCACRFA